MIKIRLVQYEDFMLRGCPYDRVDFQSYASSVFNLHRDDPIVRYSNIGFRVISIHQQQPRICTCTCGKAKVNN